jgi:hypothetical protein
VNTEPQSYRGLIEERRDVVALRARKDGPERQREATTTSGSLVL